MAESKICGITSADALDAALAGGARYVGLVFFPRSPRHVAMAHAGALARRAKGRAEVVAVTVNADDELLAEIAAKVAPDWIQAHGEESPARTAQLRQFAQRGVIKALGIARAEDFAQAAGFEPAAEMLLFDAKPPPGGLPGGNALAFDWAILAGRRFGRPWFLSGGLNPENVAEAITASGAALVDVSSGVEASPGLKDPLRIAQFLAAARA
ncbi:MAG: phosphoribosylanthranilate isomerase [Caulobacterales bacterium]|jgi:phosphoribosylanthranilate isomerase|nr:phosphoribosylanthranilate isomerase [Caulobacterales bacterium]